MPPAVHARRRIERYRLPPLASSRARSLGQHPAGAPRPQELSRRSEGRSDEDTDDDQHQHEARLMAEVGPSFHLPRVRQARARQSHRRPGSAWPDGEPAAAMPKAQGRPGLRQVDPQARQQRNAPRESKAHDHPPFARLEREHDLKTDSREPSRTEVASAAADAPAARTIAFSARRQAPCGRWLQCLALIWLNSARARSNLRLKSHIASRISRKVADLLALSACPNAKMLLFRRYPMIRGSEIR